ncbi:MAG TPA: TIGR02117 family protein [Rhizobiaceae bacterium]|nr:TIGR02117 family protein [Rhizobiaceae bacterium]
MRVLKRVSAGIAIAVLVVFLGTVVPRPLFEQARAGEATRHILVIANPIHTDIVLPLDADVGERFTNLAAASLPVTHPNAEWLVFGWGSRAFYIETPTWSELKPGPLFKALTLDSSVMHVAVTGAIDTALPQVKEYWLNDAEFERLMTVIEASFVRGSDGQPIHLAGESYGPDDAFFEAHGSFNALVGCNTWTARALREAGLQTGWWNPLPQSLAWSLNLHN